MYVFKRCYVLCDPQILSVLDSHAPGTYEHSLSALEAYAQGLMQSIYDVHPSELPKEDVIDGLRLCIYETFSAISADMESSLRQEALDFIVTNVYATVCVKRDALICHIDFIPDSSRTQLLQRKSVLLIHNPHLHCIN